MSSADEIQAAIDNLTSLRNGWLVDWRNPLFVTLHRTIDAQLAILGTGFSYFKSDPSLRSGVIRAADNALTLARAINPTP